MIISASYRTDIPAFYGRWFRNRLRAGHCMVANPYGGAPSRIALTPERVDGFVFWTRNADPFHAALEDVAAMGLPFLVHYTVTGLPRAMEPAVPPPARAVKDMRRIADRYGPDCCVWRFDPIVAGIESRAETQKMVRARFRRLAGALHGAVDEVVVSFLQVYRKTLRAMEAGRRAGVFSWRDPALDEKKALLRALAGDAAEYGMTLSLCGQPELLALCGQPELLERDAGVSEAACIDARRLARVGGRGVRAGTRAHRKTCACAESRDIGAYDSCPQGCAYCYAVASRPAAKARLARHDPEGAFLIPPPPRANPS